MKNKIIDINKLACPIMLNYALTSVFELLDGAIVGHYSVQGFALVGIAASIIYSVTGAMGILSVAFNILAADKKGKKDELGFEQLFASSKKLALIVGIGFIAMSMLLGKVFFHKIYGFEREQLRELLSYFYPSTVTVLLNMLLSQYAAYFRNLLNTKISVYVTIVSTVINLFFDYALVYGRFGIPEIGIAGAAWGSVIGLCCGLLVYQGVYYKETRVKILFGSYRKKNIFKSQLKELLSLYPSLMGQEFLENVAFVLIVTAVVARLGTAQMAVYKLLDIVCGTIGLPAYAYATATQTHALHKHAENRKDISREYLKVGTYLGIGVTIFLCILCAVWKETILRWIVTDEGIVALAGNFLWLIFLVIIVKVPYQIYMSYLQGSEREKYVFACTVAGTVITGIFVILLGYYFELSGIYWAMAVEYGVLGYVYIRKTRLVSR